MTSKSLNGSWKRHMTLSKTKRVEKLQDKQRQANSGKGGVGGTTSNYSSHLGEVYTGQANRTERYTQHDNMDSDSEINASLNILADFCTQNNEDYGDPFTLTYTDHMGDNEIKVLESVLKTWSNLNDFKIRVWNIFRQTLKYGDQFFIRDPETHEWIWVDPMNVEQITVNEARGKEPTQYYMKDLSLNLVDKVATEPVSSKHGLNNTGRAMGYGGGTGATTGGYGAGGGGTGTSSSKGSLQPTLDTVVVDARHVVHISMNTGTDSFFPFGTSILENIYKVYKQKELLEDSIIIYRVQRAPERRVFKIDVGDLPEHKAMQFVERIKNDIHQRRIPSRDGGGSSMMDAAYNPMSILEDFFFPQTADGRGSSVETLPGGDNLGQIDDLRYFNNKLIRGLQIPASYLAFGPDDSSGSSYSDGKVGIAMISEHRFNKYCMRLQQVIARTFDFEFKLYLKESGYNIDAGSFDLHFNTPLNFTSYREAELQTTRLNIFGQVADVGYLSKQFILKKYAGLTDSEISENERLWMLENPDKNTITEDGIDVGGDLGSLGDVGISPTDDMGDMGEVPMDDMGEGDSAISGAENIDM